jgi:hypothetical protein
MGLEGLQAHKPLMSVLCGKAKQTGDYGSMLFVQCLLTKACAMALHMSSSNGRRQRRSCVQAGLGYSPVKFFIYLFIYFF